MIVEIIREKGDPDLSPEELALMVRTVGILIKGMVRVLTGARPEDINRMKCERPAYSELTTEDMRWLKKLNIDAHLGKEDS